MVQLRPMDDVVGVRRPDSKGLRRFLDSPALRAPDGRILSWIGEGAYPYDEATALLLRERSWRGVGEPVLEAVLRRRLRAGWLGRGGVAYAFDTGLAARWGRAHEVAEALRAGVACRPGSDRWSGAVGAHHLKVLPALRAAGCEVEGIKDSIVRGAWTGERFRIDGEHTYLHAHCYGLEGLLGLGGFEREVEAGLQWLAGMQRPDGSLPAWTNEESRRPSDTVAQAVRLWSAVDAVRWATPILRGLGWLAAMQAPDGGIRYAPGQPERCTWATIFTAQAVAWSRVPPDRAELAALI